jgi:hypothetical protein
LRRWALSLVAAGLAPSAMAFKLEAGDPDLQMRWDNTVKYSAAYRLRNPSARLTAGDPPAASQPGFAAPGPQLDDGDRNFDRGVVSNRVDLLSEFDLTYRQWGARVSGAGWYDTVYNGRNDNTSTTVNSISVPAGEFTHDTRRVMGRNAELLDAFVFWSTPTSFEMPVNVRVGRHTVLYGESLFFGANGIAGAQAPIDLVKLLSVPGSQFKEIIRPVGQVSAQVQLSTTLSFGAYYQYKWEKNRLPPSGSFLSDVDFVGDGAERLLAGTPVAMARVGDLRAKDSGQGGMQVRFKPRSVDAEFGLYAVNYHDKGPQIMMNVPGGQYRLVYPQNVHAFGASFSTVVADANVAGEVSYRPNAPLVSAPQVDVGFQGDGGGNPLYAVGRTAHAQVSAIYLMGNSAAWDGAALLAELAWNRRLSITRNPLALDPNLTRDAMAFRMVFEPQYFQVLPGVDMSVPIGLGYNPYGRSSAVFKFNGGVERGGDFSIGLTADYQKKVKASLNFVHFYGRENAFLTTNTTSVPGLFMQTGAQSLRDRDFISLSLQSTF